MTPSTCHSCSWKKCLLLSFSIKSVCVYSVLNQCSVMTLLGSYSFGSEFRKAYLSFSLLSFSYSPFAFMVSLSAATHSGQHDTFLLELLFSFELLFPCCPCCHSFPLPSWCHLSCVHASLFLARSPKEQVKNDCSHSVTDLFHTVLQILCLDLFMS